ncbi:hypothetical protein Val02_24470 [Virgisporangium aliadipatigenens]|uniref:L-2-amino-thiazoline-4-carboxylic acid hydrolase n=1 Tax=Virgisporangium aliadipatigenens TaxID=741659 RepID=A0A8J3YKG6_9ACTN|nr:L-2-amino-thiazoline-4-carboxylic acid hydrolase [Virgisporangium aliadipatigenens]GIJ45561.1 hypothetical protein Val02_24470 [Virgisporangium aliadipatigenens]
MSHWDPDASSVAIVDAFLAHLDTPHVEEIRARQAALLAASGELPDPPARYNRRYTTAVLAAWEVLSPRFGPARHQDLLDLLREAFTAPFREWTARSTREFLDGADDPFAAMAALAKKRETTDFGVEFTFDRDEGPAHLHQDVRRCGYLEYLRGRGAAHLTPVLCAFDTAWLEAVDPARHGFVATRATTLAEGGPTCPFHFRRVR